MSATLSIEKGSVLRRLLSAEFDRWASNYDTSANPMLVLEERVLTPLLPELEGRDVLDAGCGTGRWLHHCVGRHPASLTGVDISEAMLERAGEKLGAAAKLHCTAGKKLPVANASTDVIFGSFVLSYMESVEGFVEECARVTRSGAMVLLSDIHPTTAAKRGWRRTFRDGQESVELESYPHSLQLIVAAFRRHGFEVVNLLESCFGEPEREVFAAAGRLSDFDNLASVPAIYILKLARVSRTQRTLSNSEAVLNLVGARYALDPFESANGSICLQDGRIAALGSGTASSSVLLDLSGYLVLPGLVNAHDHLEFALFPNLGRAADEVPYANASEWSEEIHRKYASVIALHRTIPRNTCLWWGAVRNLLCGATSVCHHNQIYPLLRDQYFPVRVVTQFGWAHSLAVEPAVAERHRATPGDRPFILHVGEGTDRTSAEEIFDLDRLSLLSERTVLVHGLSLTGEGVKLLNKRSSSLVTCPTSNRFLFHKLPTAALLSSARSIALGSDSPLTAAGDLLDEIHCLRREIRLSAHTIYEMVTTKPAAMLRLDRGEGQICVNSVADLIAVVDCHGTPADALANLGFEQIELVIVGGRVQLASAAIYARLPEYFREGLEPVLVNGIRRWLRAPIAEMMRVATAVLGEGTLQMGGKQVSFATSL
jgi:cytosine/adenosine deaminase-related metal-dependent hydrolase/ubiquinone/menaquinone biosynthesis C-methylase UbiE